MRMDTAFSVSNPEQPHKSTHAKRKLLDIPLVGVNNRKKVEAAIPTKEIRESIKVCISHKGNSWFALIWSLNRK